MHVDDCYDNVRFSLSDKSGELQFTHFTIDKTPECANTIQQLQNIILNRPLADIDLDEIRMLSCPGNGQCIPTVIQIIKEHQDRFLRNRSH